VETGQRRFMTFEFSSLAFSHNGKYLAVGKDGVYEVASAKRLFDITGPFARYSDDDQLVAVGEDHVYEVVSGRSLSSMGSQPYFHFMPGSHDLLYNSGAIVDVTTDQIKRALTGQDIALSPDGRLYASDGNGLP